MDRSRSDSLHQVLTLIKFAKRNNLERLHLLGYAKLLKTADPSFKLELDYIAYLENHISREEENMALMRKQLYSITCHRIPKYVEKIRKSAVRIHSMELEANRAKEEAQKKLEQHLHRLAEPQEINGCSIFSLLWRRLKSSNLCFDLSMSV